MFWPFINSIPVAPRRKVRLAGLNLVSAAPAACAIRANPGASIATRYFRALLRDQATTPAPTVTAAFANSEAQTFFHRDRDDQHHGDR